MCTIFLDALNKPLNINSNNFFFSSYVPVLHLDKNNMLFFPGAEIILFCCRLM